MLIDSNNHLIYQHYNEILNLYKLFDDSINEKIKDLNIKVGDKKINSKDYILYNFMDIQSILECIKYKKGSLLYDYVNTYLLDNIVNIDELNNYIKNYFCTYLNNCGIDFQINSSDNVIKIFSNSLELIPFINVPIEKINLMFKYITQNNLNKTIIVFINSDNFLLDLNFENVIIFDVSRKIDFYKNNILINNLTNLDINIVLDYLEKSWPIQFNKNIVLYWLKYYFEYCFSLSAMTISNNELLIIAILLNKEYKLNQKINYSNNISNIIKSFIASL